MEHTFDRYKKFLPLDKIDELRDKKLKEFEKNSHWDEYRALLSTFTLSPDTPIELREDSQFEIRSSKEIESEAAEKVSELLEALLPWRKGPFNLLGQEVDAEWRAEMKWDRLLEAMPDIRAKRVADVGCNNGYHMFRMLKYDPELVVGIDPSSRCYYQFEFLNSIARESRLHYEPFGIEDLSLFPEFYHAVFCMGVIYHRRDPYTSCRMLYDCLKKNGTLIMESLTVPGDEASALIPEDRYAKMRNVWYVPTVSALKIWLEKAGFKEVEEVCTSKVTFEEQRKTPLAPYESLSDFLDPEDSSKTIEGYTAPIRTIMVARKK